MERKANPPGEEINGVPAACEAAELVLFYRVREVPPPPPEQPEPSDG
ncbi:hypothetical protein [Desulfolucanica intricata]|nr:hypothetical protein [Desulfolucanica intricata]